MEGCVAQQHGGFAEELVCLQSPGLTLSFSILGANSTREPSSPATLGDVPATQGPDPKKPESPWTDLFSACSLSCEHSWNPL